MSADDLARRVTETQGDLDGEIPIEREIPSDLEGFMGIVFALGDQLGQRHEDRVRVSRLIEPRHRYHGPFRR